MAQLLALPKYADDRALLLLAAAGHTKAVAEALEVGVSDP